MFTEPMNLSDHHLALLLTLGATLSFATSTLVFTEFSKRVSVLWMNCFKATIALIGLLIAIPIFSGWHEPSLATVWRFMLSGLIGLNIGDLFLLSAFTRLGAGRTLILFGFQPLFIGIASYFLFAQPLNPLRLVAILFLVGCIVTFSLERYKIERQWELTGLFHALIGVTLDMAGVLLSRHAFDLSPQITPLEGNLYRVIGALMGFAAISLIRPIHLWDGIRRWEPKTRTLIITASFAGTFLSLFLYLTAVKIGHLASIAGVSITGPIFATSLECIIHRRAPSRYLLAAFVFFIAGFVILLRTS
jgi:drug/metabolite transporter (DMT)-like permease